MKRLSLGILLAMITALVSSSIAYGVLVPGIPVGQSYNANLIPQTTIDDLDGSKFATIMFLSNKANRSSITQMEGMWFLELAVGIQGLLAGHGLNSNIAISEISVKLDDHSSLAAEPADLFHVPTQADEDALAGENSWGSTASGSLGGATNSNLAVAAGLHQSIGGTFNPRHGHTGLPIYYGGLGAGYKGSNTKRGAIYTSYASFLNGPTGDATTHRLGSRSITRQTRVDFFIDFTNNEAVTPGANGKANKDQGGACRAFSNGVGQSSCPFYVINTLSQNVNIGTNMATSKNVTVTYTTTLTPPQLVGGSLESAGSLSIQTD